MLVYFYVAMGPNELSWFVSPAPNDYVWHNFATILPTWILCLLQVWLYVASKKSDISYYNLNLTWPNLTKFVSKSS